MLKRDFVNNTFKIITFTYTNAITFTYLQKSQKNVLMYQM